jgi:colanic acid/amylovoran biosynthesis glycosyltransferase
LDHFPETHPDSIIVSRLGVATDLSKELSSRTVRREGGNFKLLSVGRLHAVKNHAFLIQACCRLRDHGLAYECAIAGEGPERERLELLIRRHGLQDRIALLGHLARAEVESAYQEADVVVLTSLSEGIPLVLMEAMARSKIVLAPAITGIPELIVAGKNGFLYEPGNLQDFTQRILFLEALKQVRSWRSANRLHWIRHAARVQILHNFSCQENLTRFGGTFLQLIGNNRSSPHENSLLQQI